MKLGTQRRGPTLRLLRLLLLRAQNEDVGMTGNELERRKAARLVLRLVASAQYRRGRPLRHRHLYEASILAMRSHHLRKLDLIAIPYSVVDTLPIRTAAVITGRP